MSSQETGSKKYQGVVKWFNDAKGFGFIEHETGKDVFVHYSVIEWDGFKTLKDGEQVEYELKEGEKGLHAARVSRPNVAPEEVTTDKSEEISPHLENGAVDSKVQSLSETIEVSNDKDSSSSSENIVTPTDSQDTPKSIS